MHRANENISPKVLHGVIRQMAALQEEKLEGVTFLTNNEDPLDIQALVEGPTDTPYEGGTYRLKVCIGADFPQQPPKAVFLTKIFHPNINSSNGDVCVNTLKRDWDPANWSIGHILQVIRCLLIVPFPESSLNEEAGRMFMESYAEYATHAAMMTRMWAMPRQPEHAAPPPGEQAGDSTEAAEARKALKQAGAKQKKSMRRL